MNLVSAELIGANACYLSDDSKATCFVLTRVQNTSNAIIISTFGQASTNWGILRSRIREHGVSNTYLLSMENTKNMEDIHTWRTCYWVSSRLENFKLLVDACFCCISLLELAFSNQDTYWIIILVSNCRYIRITDCTTCEINEEMMTSLVEEALNCVRCKSCVERKMPV